MIDDIERYLNDLKEMNIKEEKDLTCKERFYSNEIISACKFGMPFSYKDMFVRDKMIILVYYRNLIAHEYYKFDEKDILKFVNERFLEQIRNFIKAKNKNSKK